jgi:hypothetical protein
LQASHAELQARSQVGCAALHAFLALSAQWFDATALVVLAPQLSTAMLPPNMPPLARMQRLFAVFAGGLVLWLAGAVLWPATAARSGRGQRGVLCWRRGLAAFATALQGCMPAHSEVRSVAR